MRNATIVVEQRRDDAAGPLVEREPRREPDGASGSGAPRVRTRFAHAALRGAFPPVIAMPSSSSRDVGPVLADDGALVDHEDAVGQREDLLQLGRHEQHGLAPVARLDELAVDELDRPDVESPRRLRREQHARVARDLAREDDLLLVASRQRAARGRRAGRRGRRTARAAVARRSHERFGKSQPNREYGSCRSRGADVLGEREVEHEAASCRSSGMWPTPKSMICARAHAGHVRAAIAIAARRGSRSPASASTSSRLAVALDAGDAEDLAARARRARRRAPPEPAVVERRARSATSSSGVARARRRPSRPRSSTSRPTIVAPAPASVAPSRGRSSTTLPRRSTVMRSAMSSTSSQLVGDEDRPTCPRRASARRIVEELVDLLRREHGGGLVEDEDVGARR